MGRTEVYDTNDGFVQVIDALNNIRDTLGSALEARTQPFTCDCVYCQGAPDSCAAATVKSVPRVPQQAQPPKPQICHYGGGPHDDSCETGRVAAPAPTPSEKIDAALVALRDAIMFRGILPLPDGRRATIPSIRLREHLHSGGTVTGLVLSSELIRLWDIQSSDVPQPKIPKEEPQVVLTPEQEAKRLSSELELAGGGLIHTTPAGQPLTPTKWLEDRRLAEEAKRLCTIPMENDSLTDDEIADEIAKVRKARRTAKGLVWTEAFEKAIEIVEALRPPAVWPDFMPPVSDFGVSRVHDQELFDKIILRLKEQLP